MNYSDAIYLAEMNISTIDKIKVIPGTGIDVDLINKRILNRFAWPIPLQKTLRKEDGSLWGRQRFIRLCSLLGSWMTTIASVFDLAKSKERLILSRARPFDK